jgi:hypothetical protein
VPLALPPVVLGAAAGRRLTGDRHTGRSTVAMLAFTPLIGLVEAPAPSGPREVVSSVVIHAPTDVVWRHVVAFPPITAPAQGIFRLGIAMPLSAEIDGRGVGAIRRCRFTTGDFVEPGTP